MYRSSKNKMIRRIGLSSVAAATALGLAMTVANAKTTHATHATGTQSVAAKAMADRADGARGESGQVNVLEVRGTISALDASSVTITDAAGTATTYSLASNLSVIKDDVAASVSDLAVGQRVEAQLSAAGSTTISSIAIDVVRLKGQVTAVNGSTISLSTPHGVATINVTGSTSYTLDGVAASASDVTVGTFVVAIGDGASTPTNFTALSVAISSTTPAQHDGEYADDYQSSSAGDVADTPAIGSSEAGSSVAGSSTTPSFDHSDGGDGQAQSGEH
jgi:hypothetical protein